MKRLIESKDGQAENYFAVIIYLLIFGILSVIGYIITSGIIGAFQDAGLYTGVLAETGNSFLTTSLMYDNVIIFLLIGFILGLGYTNYKLAATPYFFIYTFVMAAFYGFISYFFNIIFVEFATDSSITSAIVFFPKTLLLLTNLHWVMLLLIVVGSITLYAKRPKGQFIE